MEQSAGTVKHQDLPEGGAVTSLGLKGQGERARGVPELPERCRGGVSPDRSCGLRWRSREAAQPQSNREGSK